MKIEKDLSLVLRPPQHYHVDVVAYKDTDEHGTFQWSTAYVLVANDVTLAVDRAKGLSKKPHTHVRLVTQCHDPEHLVGIK